MPGENKNGNQNKIVVGDADSLVALADNKDANHNKAIKVVKWLLAKEHEIVYPNTAILEAITALRRAKNLPDKADLLTKKYLDGAFAVEYITENIQQQASQQFRKLKSKQYTIFDCIVLQTANELQTNIVFSWDDFYTRQGLVLAKANEKKV